LLVSLVPGHLDADEGRCNPWIVINLGYQMRMAMMRALPDWAAVSLAVRV
jgi:hypothetical protein